MCAKNRTSIASAVVQINQKPVTTNVAGSLEAAPFDEQVLYKAEEKSGTLCNTASLVYKHKKCWLC